MVDGANEFQIMAVKVDWGFVASLFQVLVIEFIE